MNLFIPACLITLVAIAFGGWPVGASYAKIPASWVNVLLMVTTAISMMVLNGPKLRTEPITPQQFTAGIALGLLNTVGLWAFGIILAKYPQYLPLAQAAIPAGGFIGVVFILRTPTTAGQAVCMIIAAAAIAGTFFLTPARLQ